jgi:putative two-component system response regulator
MLECLLDIKDAICEELNTISEEKQTSIQIEKLKKNLKSGGGRAEFSEL